MPGRRGARRLGRGAAARRTAPPTRSSPPRRSTGSTPTGRCRRSTGCSGPAARSRSLGNGRDLSDPLQQRDPGDRRPVPAGRRTSSLGWIPMRRARARCSARSEEFVDARSSSSSTPTGLAERIGHGLVRRAAPGRRARRGARADPRARRGAARVAVPVPVPDGRTCLSGRDGHYPVMRGEGARRSSRSRPRSTSTSATAARPRGGSSGRGCTRPAAT